MADKLEIEFTIAPDGTVSFETHGLKGESCLEETKALEARLGTVRARTRTREFHERATTAATTVGRRR